MLGIIAQCVVPSTPDKPAGCASATTRWQARGLLAAARRALRELQSADEVVLAAGIEVGDRVELVPDVVLEQRRRDAERERWPLANFRRGPLDAYRTTGVVTKIQGQSVNQARLFLPFLFPSSGSHPPFFIPIYLLTLPPSMLPFLPSCICPPFPLLPSLTVSSLTFRFHSLKIHPA
jgi:hypothetical protein